MIQTSELRIGNWVGFPGLPINGVPTACQIVEVLTDGLTVNARWPGTSDVTYKGIHWFDPIPLTPEVLAKCGFKSISDGKIFRRGQVFLHWRIKRNAWMINIHKVPMKWLHQLQNYTYACYGTELTYTP